MRAGELRHRIAFQSKTRSKGTRGGPSESWATIITLWGAIMPLKGDEIINADMRNSEITHKIKIRYTSSVDAKGRALFGSRIFQLYEVLNIDERNREMQIGAKEILL